METNVVRAHSDGPKIPIALKASESIIHIETVWALQAAKWSTLQPFLFQNQYQLTILIKDVLSWKPLQWEGYKVSVHNEAPFQSHKQRFIPL